MTWESFYLVCFFVGLILTIASFVLGAHIHLPFHAHLPFHIDFGGHDFAAHPGLGGHPDVGHAHAGGQQGLSPLNLTTLLTFLTWFGGAGYLIVHYRSGAVAIAFGSAVVLGLVGATLMYFVTARLFVSGEHPLRDEDFDMVGVLGHISSSIRSQGGTGELIYSQQGTRRSCGARSEDGRGIDQGVEVVVMRYEKGIAYVRRWDELDPDRLAQS